jgi:hypothetical protein
MAGYRVKLICSGHVQELYEYSEPILTGYVSKGGRGLDGAEEEDKGRNKLKNIARCKAEIARLINKNSCSDTKFCSFTFAENVSDYDYCFNEWKKFVKRYNRYCRSVLGLHGFKLKYLVVWEFQKRGALHFHAVMFNAPYISNKKKDGYPLQKLWSNGHIWINKTDDNCDNLGLYVSKYLGKDLQATTSRKKYFTETRSFY